MKKQGIKFRDENVGFGRSHLHFSPDEKWLYDTSYKSLFKKIVETKRFVYYQNDTDDYIMFSKNNEGILDDITEYSHLPELSLICTLEQIWTGSDEDTLLWMDKKTRRYLPEFARDFEWQAIHKKALDLTFTEVCLEGQTALFTKNRITKNSVPRPFLVYEIKHAAEDYLSPAHIAKHMPIDHFGTLVMLKPLDLSSLDFRGANLKKIDFSSGKQRTLNEFAQEQNVKLKSCKDRER